VAGKHFSCKIIEKTWVTPTVMQIRFEASKRFSFEPGQFLSVVVPVGAGQKPVRRIYSLSAAPHERYYELCVKHMNGPGTNYLKSLNVGDSFDAAAPYGDLVYETKAGRNAVFISTGTGIAPFKSIVQSKRFKDHFPDRAFMVFGARTVDEIIYPGMFAKLGMKEVNCVSDQPAPLPKGVFQGRVTDWLKSLPADWDWQITDFYLCGNGAMVADVVKFLKNIHHVPESSIHKEVYFITSAVPAAGQERPPAIVAQIRKAV
jgi:ring-1,2-phenylacetyl-CoA epoxidase subunit PaaE